jgi:hypothetical protein
MIKTGDIIYCHDVEDMIHTSEELANSDIETDFLYERDGEKGYFLEVTKGEYDEVDGETIYHLPDGKDVVVEYDRYDTCKVSREGLEMLTKRQHEQLHRANALAILGSVENLKSDMCDRYCKYPSHVPEGKTEDWLIEDDDSPCLTCPMNKL